LVSAAPLRNIFLKDNLRMVVDGSAGAEPGQPPYIRTQW